MSAGNDRSQKSAPDDSHKPHPKSRSIDSQALFGNAETLCIHHLGLTYTLRKTRNGKLILNK